DSANSQFFLMTGQNDNLNGSYTVFGRVLQGLDVVKSLKKGNDASDGAVGPDADAMGRVRLASAMPEAERPTMRVAVPGSAPFNAAVEAARAEKGASFTICDVQPPVQGG
ncbi:peptidylprolyl isomerase, partial [Brevundimonas naejangsanensis]